MRIALLDRKGALASHARVLMFCGTLSLLAGCGGTGAPPPDGADGEPPRTADDPARSRKNLPEWAQRVGDLADRLDQSEQNHRQAMAELNNRLAMMEKQVSTLQGSVEEVRHDGKRLNERIDMIPPPEPKMAQTMPTAPAAPTVESPPPAAAATPNQPPAAVAAPPSAAATAAASQPPRPATPPAAPATATAPAPAAAKPATPAAPAAPVAAAPAATGNPKEIYEAAFQQLKQGQYEAAKTGFQSFLKSHGKDPMADNAQYWIGELHYVQRQFPEALMAFNQVLLRWPNSGKVPDSLLKIGFSFYELNDMENANTSLQRLVKDFPNSSPAAVAKPRLDVIKKKLGR
ncbi:MAG: tol-pal system protein YbgF [Magnetococcales bacterium]|nr:tol-pal system protein YbgF [Magnetococcales bacterium]